MDLPGTDGSLKQCSTCRGHEICVVGRLTPTLLKEFETIVQLRVYDRGSMLFCQGNRNIGFFMICSGWVKLTYIADNGRATTVGLCRPGSGLGFPEILTEASHRVSAEVVTRSKIGYVSRSQFLLFLEENPTVAFELLRTTCYELERVLAELCEISIRTPSAERLLHVLQDLSTTCGRLTTSGIQITLPLTQQDLADRIGCSRQWLCGLLRDLQTQGMIRRKRGWIELTAQAKCQIRVKSSR